MANIDELRARIAAARGTQPAAVQPVAAQVTPVEQPVISTVEVPSQAEIQPVQPQIEAVQPGATEESQSQIDILRGRVNEARNVKAAAVDSESEWLDVLREGFSNIPESALRFAGDIKTAVTNPVQTAGAIGGLLFGAIDAALPDPGQVADDPDAPGQTGEQLEASRQNRANLIDTTVSHLQDRYGSLEKFKQTVASDPVGVSADVASILTPGGALVKTAGKSAQLNRLAKLGNAAQKVGTALEPVQLAKQLAFTPVNLITKAIKPTELFLSSAKISKTIPPATRQKLAQLALDEKIFPTSEGLEKLRGQINGLGREVTDLIDDAGASGKKVNTQQLFSGFKALRQEIKASSTNPKADLAAVDKIAKSMMQQGLQSRTPAQLQLLKQKVQSELAGLYGKMTQSPIKRQAQNEVAVAARTILEDMIPGIEKLNSELGPRLELRKALEGAAARIENSDIVSLRTGVAGTAGAAAGGLPGLVGGAAMGLLDKPGIKNRLAVVLNELKKLNPEFVPSQAISSIIATAPARADLVNEEQPVTGE